MLLVMLVDDDLVRCAPLKKSLADAGYNVIAHLSTTENLDVAVREMQPDIVIIDTDSPSRDTLENLCVMNETVPKPIVMFTHDGDIQKMRAATKVGVSAYVVGSLASDSLMPVINAAIVRFEEVKLLKDELDQTKLKLAERKLLERAKGLLMKAHDFDEDHAYAMLRSMAMGQSKRIAVLAREVIEAATRPL
ncbi:AmiR Response regulator with putative antiterminator output domain [Methylophilaceae bacterium]